MRKKYLFYLKKFHVLFPPLFLSEASEGRGGLRNGGRLLDGGDGGAGAGQINLVLNVGG